MTATPTPTPTPTAAEVRASLSAGARPTTITAADFEREGYSYLVSAGECVVRYQGTRIIGFDSAQKKDKEQKYIFDYRNENGSVTGKLHLPLNTTLNVKWLNPQVLAASPVTVAAVGEAKPATITAREFVAGGYAEKVKAGECRVIYQATDVVTVEHHEGKWEEYDLYEVATDDDDDPFFRVENDAKFTVTWLPTTAKETPQTADEKPAADPRGGFYSELKALLLKYGEDTSDHASRIGTSQDIDSSIPIERRYTDTLRSIYIMANHVDRELAATRAALSAAEATADGLRKALKPFAEAAKNLIGPYHSGYDIEEWGVVEKPQGDFLGVTEITVRDLRAAREALADANAAPGEPDAEGKP